MRRGRGPAYGGRKSRRRRSGEPGRQEGQIGGRDGATQVEALSRPAGVRKKLEDKRCRLGKWCLGSGLQTSGVAGSHNSPKK